MQVCLLTVLVCCSLLILANVPGREAKMTKSQQKIMLDGHNMYRRRAAKGHIPNQPRASNMKKMIWSDTLAAKAQKLTDKCTFRHGPRGQFGENLAAWTYHSTLDLAQGLAHWYSEVEDYGFYHGSCAPGKKCGHYTQLVHAESEYLGCGFTNCLKASIKWALLVCNYTPGGNNGKKPYRVAYRCIDCSSGYHCADALCSKV